MSKGKLIVITGHSGAGKDAVIDKLLKRLPEFRLLVSYTDRQPRNGEIHGVHYHFVESSELDRFYINGELIEKPLVYGTSRKATPKTDFKNVIYHGHKIIWRIDTSLAAKVANNSFFVEKFDKYEQKILSRIAKVIFITAPKETLEKRRKARDKDTYDEHNYKKRDYHDQRILTVYKNVFSNIVVNEDGMLDETIKEVEEIIR